MMQRVDGIIVSRTYLRNRYRYMVEVKGYENPLEVTNIAKLQIGDLVQLGLPNEKRRVLQLIQGDMTA